MVCKLILLIRFDSLCSSVVRNVFEEMFILVLLITANLTRIAPAVLDLRALDFPPNATLSLTGHDTKLKCDLSKLSERTPKLITF